MTEEPQVDQCTGARRRPGGEAADQGEPADQRHEHLGADEARAALDPGQPVDDGGDTGGEQEQADDVQAGAGAAGGGAVVGQGAPGEPAADQTEGDVDEKDPAPVGQAQDDPAQDRAEDGTERGGQGDGGHDLADVAALGGLHDQGGHEGHHDAAADALDDAEGDETGRVPGQGAQYRAEQERTQCGDPEPLAAEPGLGPPGERDGDEHGQQIAGAHPLDRGQRSAQCRGEVVEGDGDDGGVEDDGEGADDDGEGQAPHGGIDAVGVRWRGSGAGLGRARSSGPMESAHGKAALRYRLVSCARQSRAQV